MKLYFVLMMMNIECFCDICDKFCAKRFYKNPLKTRTHINNIHNRQNSIIFISTVKEPKQ